MPGPQPGAYNDGMKDAPPEKPSKWLRPEYVLIGALLLIGAVAVPAVANVYLLQSMVVAFCAGLGIPVN